MNARQTDRASYRPARGDRAAVVTRLIERLPARVTAALQGDREALIGLLLIAADVAWQSRAEAVGTVEEVAAAVHEFADAVADCYSADQPPSGRLCDTGFTLADRVDALAIEVLQRRLQAGVIKDAALAQPAHPPAQEARHLARAHVAALRDAAVARRVLTNLDVEAAEHLYQAIVALVRQHARQAAATALDEGLTQPVRPPTPPPAAK